MKKKKKTHVEASSATARAQGQPASIIIEDAFGIRVLHGAGQDARKVAVGHLLPGNRNSQLEALKKLDPKKPRQHSPHQLLRDVAARLKPGITKAEAFRQLAKKPGEKRGWRVLQTLYYRHRPR